LDFKPNLDVGDSNSSIMFLVESPAASAATESWNGTSWTTVNSLNTALDKELGGAGTQTSGFAYGGNVPGTIQAQQNHGMELQLDIKSNKFMSTARRAFAIGR
jgi:hypothetical protein